MKLKEFIALYSQGRKDAELELNDFIAIYDNGAFEAYDSADDMAAILSPLLDKEIAYSEHPTCQDVEIEVCIDGEKLFDIAAISQVCEW